MMRELPDIQKTKDGFPQIYIEKVGVENIKMNLPIAGPGGKVYWALGSISSYCSLTEKVKGINMSRIGQTIFSELKNYEDTGISNLEGIARQLWVAHGDDSQNIYISAEFDYMVDRTTPVTKLDSPKVIRVVMSTKYDGLDYRNYLTVKSVEMSSCPCSAQMSLLKNNLTEGELEEIEKLPEELRDKVLRSGFGAHNQKSEIEVTVELSKAVKLTIEEISEKIEKCASAPTYSTLKRPDEKWVTEVSYMGGYYEDGQFVKADGGPKFVEDIARQLAKIMKDMMGNKIEDFMVYVRNYESIHSENIVASAYISAGRELKK